MTYATATNSFHGQRYDILVDVAIGATTLRWSMGGVTDSSASYAHYEARILDAGTIDRSMESAPLATGDCTMVLANTDGSLDTFVNYSTSTENVILGTFTVKRVVIADGSTETLAVFSSLRFTFNRDKTVTINLANDELFFGEVPIYTVADIVTELRTDYGTRFGSSGANVRAINDRIGAMTVPYAFGNFSANRGDGLYAHAAFKWNPSGSGAEVGIGSTTDGIGDYYVAFVALNPYGFYTSPPEPSTNFVFSYINEDGEIEQVRDGQTAAQDYEVINLANIGNNGLDLLVFSWKASNEQWRMEVAADCFTKTQSTGDPPKPFAAWGGGHTLDLVQMVVEELGSTDKWSASVDATNFTALKRKAPYLQSRGVIQEQRPALWYCSEIAKSFDLDLFVNKSGKLAAHLLSPEGKGGTYSSALSFVDDDDFIGWGGGYHVDGRHKAFGLINEVRLGVGPNHFMERGHFWKRDSRGDPMGVKTSVVSRSRNSTSITNHGRTETVEEQRPWISQDALAAIIGNRLIDLHANPRALLRATASIRASQLELGDIVKVTEGAAPQWSADRYCVVWSMADRLFEGTVTLELADFNDILGASVYILDDEDNWLVMTQGSGESVDFTASTATIACNGFDPAAKGILAGDVFSRRGWPGAAVTGTNDFNCVINAVNGTPTNTIVLESGGGEDGSLPGSNESTATDFRIFRGQGNRDTTGGDYTAVDSKYGVLCWSDGFFRDDATEGYKYGVNA